MNMTLEKFMGLAITAVVIMGLVFAGAATMIKDETTGATGYKSNVESPVIPTSTSLTP